MMYFASADVRICLVVVAICFYIAGLVMGFAIGRRKHEYFNQRLGNA